MRMLWVWLPACLPACFFRSWRCAYVQEQQVVSLKAAHPGVLLLVEVGYKMRMFGQDAEVAAKVIRTAADGVLGAQAATGVRTALGMHPPRHQLSQCLAPFSTERASGARDVCTQVS
jgi:hypothetical protein